PAPLPVHAPPPPAPAPQAVPKIEVPSAQATPSGHIVKAPIVGTFYSASSPETPPYVKVGDSVSEGQTLCIIEAMKLMNEIEAEVSGKVLQILVENGKPVEYDQALFVIG
ncbi:MAG TPA: acetyl-CoA carboxylase biotin carboxyl carrier protein, partial [Rhodothermales bacterium]|nr:acetyl-CoA carboxylase biotin carboxyl carrier protein [Rhodothermales bacterium]